MYNVPKTTFLFYLRLRLALLTYGVPWGETLATHLLHLFLDARGQTKGLTSKIYAFLNSVCKHLNIDQIWSRDLGISVKNMCWSSVLKNLDCTSKYPNHKLIHSKFLHGTYLTPKRLYLMKLIPSSRCELCQNQDTGTFMHMYWHCPKVEICLEICVLVFFLYVFVSLVCVLYN